MSNTGTFEMDGFTFRWTLGPGKGAAQLITVVCLDARVPGDQATQVGEGEIESIAETLAWELLGEAKRAGRVP